PLTKPLTFFRRLIKNFIIKEMHRRSMNIVKEKPYKKHKREEGIDWPLFGYTMVGQRWSGLFGQPKAVFK
ncbi:MAG: hypothetical protein GY801_51445, partial [bacterium]|nr:hypothetical protein [bacterium]